MKELKQDELKDTVFDIEKIVTTDITRQIETYQPKQVAYCLSKEQYVQIKRYDENRKVYICKPKRLDDPLKLMQDSNPEDEKDVEL